MYARAVFIEKFFRSFFFEFARAHWIWLVNVWHLTPLTFSFHWQSSCSFHLQSSFSSHLQPWISDMMEIPPILICNGKISDLRRHYINALKSKYALLHLPRNRFRSECFLRLFCSLLKVFSFTIFITKLSCNQRLLWWVVCLKCKMSSPVTALSDSLMSFEWVFKVFDLWLYLPSILWNVEALVLTATHKHTQIRRQTISNCSR